MIIISTITIKPIINQKSIIDRYKILMFIIIYYEYDYILLQIE